MTELQGGMPPGWDCKLDEKTGKYYFVNHYTRTTTWEDPRNRHRPFQGTPKHFGSVQNECIPLQDMKPKMSPLSVRSPKVQDSSLSLVTDTDEAVGKIAAMFPTVSETHIRILLKNCRYMKSVFPHADETVILDILQNNDNNIQKTSDALRDMGYSKKDTVKVAQDKLEAKKDEQLEEENKQSKPATPPPKLNTIEDKETLKKELQDKYKDVAEHLIVIALESVHFDKNRANQILQIMIQENNQVEESKQHNEVQIDSDVLDAPSTSKVVDIPVSQSRQSLKSLLKAEKDVEKVSYCRILEEKDGSYRSPNLSNTKGQNPSYAKGPNEKLLLEDYVRWQGGNPSLRKGAQVLAHGSNKSLLSSRSYQICGPNNDIRRGPKFGLAKGTIFCQVKTVVVGESCRE